MARQPRRLHDFIGQKRVVGHVEKLVKGSRRRGKAMCSLLLAARSGHGKTALAQALAREFGGDRDDGSIPCFRQVIGGAGIVDTLRVTLRDLRFADILFIDEAQSLCRASQESLYIALDRRKTYSVTEQGQLDRSELESIADFGLILATSEPGMLLPPLRGRLTTIEFEPYSISELKGMAQVAAEDGYQSIAGGRKEV